MLTITTFESDAVRKYKPNAPVSEKPKINTATSAETVLDKWSSTPNTAKTVYAMPKTFDEEKIWQAALEQCAQNLKNALPDVSLYFLDTNNREQIGQFASGLSHGTHIIISKDFWERAAFDGDSFNESKQLIENLWQQLNQTQKAFAAQGYDANISVALDENGEPLTFIRDVTPKDDYQSRFFKLAYEGSVRYYKEKGGRNITEIQTPDGSTVRMVITKRLNYRPGKDLARLARTNTNGNIKSLIGNLQGQINRAKVDKSLDEDEVRQAIAQMKAVIGRAQRKIKQLNEENQLDIQRKNALKQKELKEAQALAKELKRRRTLRRSREYGQISEHFARTYRYLLYHDNQQQQTPLAGYLSMPTTEMALETIPSNAPSVPSIDLSI